MFLKLLVVAALAVVAASAAEETSPDIQIVKYDTYNIGNGDYKFYYELSNGQNFGEEGHFEPGKGPPEKSDDYDSTGTMTVRGSYSYVGPDGITYTVTYVADKNGFRPTIEQGPNGAVPAAVLKALPG